jgi:putative ABC transport system permease protein
MMGKRNVNRSMFWRVVRRLLFANRGRLSVMLLALAAGSAVTAALLNLQVDAKRRLATEFRAFGANVIVSPRPGGDSPKLLRESTFGGIPDRNEAGTVAKAMFLYGVVEVSSEGSPARARRVVLAGYAHAGARPREVLPQALIDAEERYQAVSSPRCAVGRHVASALGLAENQRVALASGSESCSCGAMLLPPTGGPEDDQIFFELPGAQMLLGEPGRISLIQLSVPGSPAQIRNFLSALQSGLGDAEGRPVRQLTEGEALLYGKISGILSATVAVVLLLTALCVMAAMTNAAMERRNDVGLMKAIGGSVRRVLRLFLVEALLLGLAGGVLGASAGLLLSIGLGKAVFGVAAEPRLIVYPISVALTVIVAIFAAYPLRRLAQIRPSNVFRGES